MSNKLPKLKHQGRCIFCDGTGLSKEHIYPDWLKNILFKEPSIINREQQRISVEFYDDKAYLREQLIKKNGHLWSSRLRIVCVKCNGGWMSKLQDLNKPILSSLMLGENIKLSKKNLFNLSLWVVISTMVAEFDNIKRKRIPDWQLKFLKEKNNVPPGWKIWIG